MQTFDAICYSALGLVLIVGLISLLRARAKYGQNHHHNFVEKGFEIKAMSGGKYVHDPNNMYQKGVFVTHEECECGEKRDRKEIGFV